MKDRQKTISILGKSDRRLVLMERRIIFLDIDGTLTEPGSNEPPKSAVWAVRQAQCYL